MLPPIAFALLRRHYVSCRAMFRYCALRFVTLFTPRQARYALPMPLPLRDMPCVASAAADAAYAIRYSADANDTHAASAAICHATMPSRVYTP